MKITAQEEYGLRCLIQLAHTDREASLTIPEIAASEGLSTPYVAKLLAVMRQAGLIDSVRGRSGGYRLAKPPEEIILGNVLLVLGEPLFEEPAFCEQHAGTETNGVCVHRGGCTLRTLWQTLETWMRQALDQITLADLLQGAPHLLDLLRIHLAQVVEEASAPLIALNTVHKN